MYKMIAADISLYNYCLSEDTLQEPSTLVADRKLWPFFSATKSRVAYAYLKQMHTSGTQSEEKHLFHHT